MRGPATLAAEEARLLACVHCGFCLPACPTYTRLGDEADSPRGRLHLMRAVAEGRLEPDASAFITHLDRCLGCRACETACPSGVEYGYLLERAREVVAETTGSSRLTRLLLNVFGSRTLSEVTLAIGRVVRRTGIARLLLRILPRRFSRARFGLAMLGATAPWSGLRQVPVRAPGKSLSSGHLLPGHLLPGHLSPAGQRDASAERRVAILRGCVQEGLYQRVNTATEEVLRANGYTLVELEGEACCGALHAHAGEREPARKLARANIMAFDASGAECIVINAAGCSAAMKEYGRLLEDEEEWAERAAEFSSRVHDLFEFLAARGVRPGAPLELSVTYHPPCHLYHGQGIREEPIEVLRAVTGVEVFPLAGAEECCGGAGIYGMTHPELGGSILHDKVNAVRETSADVVLTPNPGCMMQIGAGLLLAGAKTPVLHPVELLAESYRRATSD